MEFIKTPVLTEGQLDWITQEDAIARQENQTMALEANTEAMLELAASNRALAEAQLQTAQANDYIAEQIERLANATGPCDITGWNLSESLSNMTMTLDQAHNLNQYKR